MPVPLQAPDFVVDQRVAAHGATLYKGICALCHGPAAVSGGKAPDLRASAIVLSPQAFADVVRGGQREALGMPRFPEFSTEDLEGLRHYIRSNVRVPVM
jgi:quinohemoprotein ethanol dehydrogenase